MAPIDNKYYELLDVPSEATPDELSSAYKKMALKLHPDKGGNAEQFKAMKAAYDVLKDPQKRQLYDNYGPGFVRAMDGEVLEPEVMLQILVATSRMASRLLLCALPFLAALLLFPAVAVSLKWDGRVSWNWNIVFIPAWLAQVLVLILVLKLRSIIAATGVSDDEEQDEEERAASDLRKRQAKRLFTMGACIVLAMIIQEALLAGKFEGYIQASWFVVIIPYLVMELLWLLLQIYPLICKISCTTVLAVIVLLAPTICWLILRLCTVSLLAAKAQQLITPTWLLCLLPLMIGAGVKLLVASCRPEPPREDVDEHSSAGGLIGAVLSVAAWLIILILGARKLDGSTYSAFLVFLPFFLGSAQLLCCCTCLACCGPVVLETMMKQEQEEQQSQRAEQGSEKQSLNPVPNDGKQQDYSTMSEEAAAMPV